LEEGAESEAGNGSSSLDVYETDEEGTDFGDGETEDPGATEKTMRSVLREIPERTEEEEPGEEADARSTADEANGAEAEQPDSPASALGEPIQLPDHPADQFSLGTAEDEDTPEDEGTPHSQSDSAKCEPSTTRLTRSSTIARWEKTVSDAFETIAAQVDMHVPRSVLEMTERVFEVDLPRIMRIIGRLTNEERASADAILRWFQAKDRWNLGTEQSLYERFDPQRHTVSTLHRAVIIGKLGSRIRAILVDWASEKRGEVTGRRLYLPRSWPRNAKQHEEDTREWAKYVVRDAEMGRVRIPERALVALKQYTIEPTQVQQPAPTQQAPPANPRDLRLVTANQERTHPRTRTGGAAPCAGLPGEERASQRAYRDTSLVPTAAQQGPARRGQRDGKEHASLPGGSKQQHKPGSRPVPSTRTDRGRFQRGAAGHGRLGRTGSTSEPEPRNGRPAANPAATGEGSAGTGTCGAQ
jgi:hypothetical protein